MRGIERDEQLLVPFVSMVPKQGAVSFAANRWELSYWRSFRLGKAFRVLTSLSLGLFVSVARGASFSPQLLRRAASEIQLPHLQVLEIAHAAE
jgi:hypothetical protein